MGLVLVNSDLAARKSIQHLLPYKSVFRPFLWSLYTHKYSSQSVFSSSLTLFRSLSCKPPKIGRAYKASLWMVTDVASDIGS
eukprot:2780046-Rhodomonas_salina.1